HTRENHLQLRIMSLAAAQSQSQPNPTSTFTTTPAVVPRVVKEAIASYLPRLGRAKLPPTDKEKSFIYKWGVRLVNNDNEDAAPEWICMADEGCRHAQTAIILSCGKTSKAVTHLKEAHGLASERTQQELERKRTREDDLQRLERSQLFRDDPGRVYVLLETLRIVNNNLPFAFGEFAETLAIRDLAVKQEMRAAINANVVRHAVVELYTSTKRQVESELAACRIGSAKCFSIVGDFWTSKSKKEKYLGLRIYMVDKEFQFKSILLGTRHFAPLYSERDGGIRGPFQRWLGDILTDFGIRRCDIFGSTSDGGADVKWMMCNGLKLNWEWCVPHLSNAATKMACGLVADTQRSKNPAMTDLLRRIVRTVYQTQHVEVVGTLFSELCSMIRGDESVRQLLDYRAHRFLGLTRVVRRILLLWDPLVIWYSKRQEKARRENQMPPPAFPLSRDKMDLIQLLSLLEPITELNAMSQAERPNQSDVLLFLYKLRVSTLDVSKPLLDCRSTAEEKTYFQPEDLSIISTNTRTLLAKTFHTKFFQRYTNRTEMNRCSYVFEMQLLLHPNFKNPEGILKKMIERCNLQAGASQQVAQRHYAKVRRIVMNTVRKIMVDVD
ncbi:hypothetical protein BBJ28_00027223, partial [Nothophytophthora sp. Chile5]